MSSDENPGESAADDGMADWAEALLEQKASDAPGASSAGWRIVWRYPATVFAVLAA